MMLAFWGSNVDAAAPSFSCSFGRNHVSVSSLGGKLVYRYGSSGADELTIVQDPQKKNVSSFHDMGARSELRSLRFVNGAYSYVIFSFFQAGKGYTDESGLAVLKGGKRLTQQMCKSDAALSDEILAHLPEDPNGGDLYDLLKL